ncbi:hypothetical protein TWF281_002696 [Arthrobotrys megalospora]
MVHPLMSDDSWERPLMPSISRLADHVETVRRLTETLRGWEQITTAYSKNKAASSSASQLLPVPKLRRYDGASLFGVPDYFPSTVWEFLRMSAGRVIYLLNFYDIPVWLPDPDAEPSDQDAVVQLEISLAGVASNYLRCLEAIAVEIGLKLGKIRSRKLEKLRSTPYREP